MSAGRPAEGPIAKEFIPSHPNTQYPIPERPPGEGTHAPNCAKMRPSDLIDPACIVPKGGIPITLCAISAQQCAICRSLCASSVPSAPPAGIESPLFPLLSPSLKRGTSGRGRGQAERGWGEGSKPVKNVQKPSFLSHRTTAVERQNTRFSRDSVGKTVGKHAEMNEIGSRQWIQEIL
jgi:hypothetical protein